MDGDALVFDRGANDPTRVGDEVGDVEDAATREGLFRSLGDRDVGALYHQPGFEPVDVALVDYVGTRRRDPDIAFDIDDCVAIEFIAAVVLGDAAAFGLERDQRVEIETRGIEDGAAGVRDRNRHRSGFA